MGRLVASRGRALGFDRISIASRRPPEEGWLRQTGATYLSLVDLERAPEADVAVGCLGAQADPIDPWSELPKVTSLFVDLGTPRNFARISEGPTPVITIAGIIASRTAGEEAIRRESASRLRATVAGRLLDEASDGASPLGRLRKNVEQTRRREAARLAAANPDMDPAAIDAMTRALVNRLFHRPTESLRGEPHLAATFADLFEPGPDAG
jgi:glutamyl-tRNA reductase